MGVCQVEPRNLGGVEIVRQIRESLELPTRTQTESSHVGLGATSPGLVSNAKPAGVLLSRPTRIGHEAVSTLDLAEWILLMQAEELEILRRCKASGKSD